MARAHAARGWTAVQGFDPLRPVFKLFTSVRFAIVMVLIVAVAALLGVVFPQAPDPVRLNPAAYDIWMETQRARYGPFAEPMHALGLFSVFHSTWFNGLFFILLGAVGVCTANRFAPTWRAVRRPVRVVNDRYFERAHARAASKGPVDAQSVEQVLRAHRYQVERVAERGDAVYLFADRYAWAQFATFASHLSLILFMAGGIVSKLAGFSTFIEVGEGMTQPVFPVVHPNQMQVQNLDSVEGRDGQGRIIDYRTHLVIYRNGRELCRGSTTVNDPLGCAGYRFHQAAYSEDGAALRVRDLRTGAVVYAEAPVLSRRPAAPAPRLVVEDAASAVLFDDFLVLAPLDDRRSLAPVALAGMNTKLVVTAFRSGDRDPWKLSVIHLRDKDDPADKDFQVTLTEGASEQVAGLRFSFPELRGLPALIVEGVPGIEPVALLQLASEPDGTPVLDVQNVARRDSPTAWMALRPYEPVVAGDYEYSFEGRREYTGVLVRRDPGAWLIWVGATLLIGGLVVTFYVPRRRLWLKITPERAVVAGIAQRTAHLSTELQRLLVEAQGGERAGTPSTPTAADGRR